jgi:hydrophobic/amphiphilic exporter-1 (mainly G- bacteria), HAE1 family
MAFDEDADKAGFGLRLAEFSMRHPVTVCMIFTCFVVLGAISVFKIPLVMIPAINAPFVEVYVPYPNATPAQTQESIAKPLEEVLATVPNVQRLTSRSGDSSAWIDLNFGWDVDVDWARAEIREKVEQVRSDLPDDIDRIMVRNFATTDIPILEGRIFSEQDLRSAYDFLETKVKNRLERLDGVAEIEIWGAQRKEVDIYLRLDDIKRYDVDVGTLFRNLDNANLDTSLGRVTHEEQRYSAIARGAMSSLDAIRSFPVNERGLRLDAVADIYFDRPVTNNGRHLNGDYTVGFAVRKTSSANTVQIVNQVNAEIAAMNADPSMRGTTLEVWFDQGEEILKSLTGLLQAGTIGALLAVIVLFLFLRKLGPTLVIGFAIPFSIIATVGFLYLLGKSLNVLSMMGLMLASGMLVDNAVVVLESIYQHLEKGKERVLASRIGTKEVVTAVLAATLTSIIIFVPLVFGKKTNFSIWLEDVGASIIIALLCSLFISLTLIPLAVARLLKLTVNEEPKWHHWLVSKMPKQKKTVTERYLGIMGWTLRHRYVVGFLIIPAILVGSFIQLKNVPDNAPNAEELDDLNISYEFTENYHYVKIEQDFVNPVEEFLLGNKERFKIKDVYSWYGNSEARTRIYFDKDRITLDELADIRPMITKELPVIPGAEISLGSQSGADNQEWIQANVIGDDPQKITELAQEARRRLLEKDEFSEVFTDMDQAREEVQIRLNRALARKYNVSPQSVAGVLSVVVRGQRVRGYRTPEGEVDIWVRLQPDDREDMGDLRSIVVGNGPDGTAIQLAQVADFNIVKTPASIRREDRQTYTWVSAIYTGDKKDDGKKIVSEVFDSLEYPAGYGWSYGFWTQREDAENNEFMFNILLALFMVYFVMASLFESLAHPFAIILSLPFALVGVAWMLTITGTPFNIMSQIGLLVLLGIVVNNGIVLLDHVNNQRRAGLPRPEAIMVACRERFRPILMTATTTIVGLIPLAIGDSGLFDMRYFPLARTVMGGLISSTFLTLLVLPTYYTMFDDLANWMKRVWQNSKPTPKTAPPESQPALGD